MKVYDSITIIFDFYKKSDMCKIEFLEEELGIIIPRHGKAYSIDIEDKKEYIYNILRDIDINVEKDYDKIFFKVEV